MKAIVTLCIGEEYKLGEITHPLLKSYADKIGADFIVISESKINLGNHNFEKFQIYELFEKYSRIIYLDTDIIVTPECPNLFEIVPQEIFGAFFVSEYTYFHDGAIKKIQDKLGNIGWARKYFNAGVMVASKQHRNIFSKENGLLEWSKESGAFYDQTLFNYTIQRLEIPVYDIGYKFNHTTDPQNSILRFGRRINQSINFVNSLLTSILPKYKQYLQQKQKNENYIVHYQGKKLIQHRFNSHIIHYTGKGHRQRGSKLEQIQKDLFLMKYKSLNLAVKLVPFLENFL
ncbi:MAG: glycosyltransferase [Calothrix sp. MO_167.B12]|nr:glycosyltransferase [Calothrix sp. MO_167.B12]